MKTSVFLAAAGAIALTNAKPHGHAHHHHRREPAAVTVTSDGAVTTAFAFVLNGVTISKADVCAGISSGELKWDGEVPDGACEAASSIAQSVAATSTPAPSSSSSVSATAGQFFAASSSSAQASSSSSAAATTKSTAAASSSSAVASTKSSAAASSSPSTSSSSSGSTKFVASNAQSSYPDFPDGEVKCSDGPPTKYGAMRVDYLGYGGWSGSQQLNSALTDIVSTGTGCSDGMACSYACHPGWQKLQWPSTQPSSGASIGGLLCKNGYLYKTSDSAQLCNQGTGGVKVQNLAGGDLSICRTDYPGTESETVPVDIVSQDTQPLACPDETTYFKHQGSMTSAQYYLNPIGVSSDPGCSWEGNSDKKTGNWAPINLGVGATGGTKWLSIFQNAPTSSAVFQGSVNITGSGISGPCYYESISGGSDGQYCGMVNGAMKCQTVSSGGTPGCTVSVTGDAVFVVSS